MTNKKSLLNKIINVENRDEEIENPFLQIEKLDDNETNLENADWEKFEEGEGQLALDVYETKDSIIVKSTIAGAKPEDIEISVNNDMLTIRGSRKEEEEIDEENYFYRECYWGNFSRSIILPKPIEADKINAKLKNGILTITLPKTKPNKTKIDIEYIED